MAFQIFVPPLQPSIGSGISWSVRLIENNFGDGYRQTAPDGLNAVSGSINLSWDMLTMDQANAIEFFIRSNIGQPFRWAPPHNIAYLWDCKAWNRTNVSGANDKITATFNQRFDLGP